MLAGLTISVSGQIKAARNEMAQYNYPKAIEILHQFIQKADPKTKSEATLLMADCYRLEYDMQDARAWYFKAIKLGNTQPLTYFYYAKALRACGEYESAKKIFLQYDSLMPDDHRGKIYASFCDSAMAWDEKPFAFEVNNARNLNSASSEFGPIFYNDGVVFATDKVMSTEEEKKSGWAGHGYLKLVFANPKQQEDYYGDYNLPRLIPELYTNGSNDGPATFSKDGNEVFITRTIKSSDKSKDEAEEGPSNQLKIYTATKAGDKWSKLRPFFFNSNNYSVGYPALSPDDNSLYFVSDVDGGYGGTDIYVTSRVSGNWSKPENLGPIVNTFGDETFPFVADNGDLYFASDGHPGYGGLDIFVTRKVGNVWLNPQNLGKPINSSYDDFALAMYKNDSVGLFSANRPGGRGEDDIYSFRVVGPLPTLTSQPAIAAVQNPPKQQESQPKVKEERQVPPPSPEKVVPVPEPVTAQVIPPAQQQTPEIKPEVTKQQETQPAVTSETKISPPSPEKVIPMPERATAEVTPPAQQQTTEIKPEVTKQQETQPTVTSETKITPPSSEKVIPMPERATAEVTPPAQQQTTEIKPEVPTQQETQSGVTAETKEPPPSPEKVVPTPAPVITEAEPNLQQPQTGKVSGTIIAESTLQKVIVSGCIKDRSNNVVIPSATIFFLNEKNGKVYVHKTNSTGCFKSELISGIDYKVKAMQTGYLSDCIPYSSPVSNTLAEATLSNDLLLDNAGVMQTYKIENIYYDFDRYFIRADAEPTLKKLIRIMNEIPITVELGSHADCRGSDAYNMILTEKRANSAFQYIVKGGIDGSRITRHWYGKTQLTNNCNCAEGVHCTEAQHQANRRTEFKISVPSSIMQETAIDLEKYHDGDTLDLHFLPADFFENCNHRLISGPLAELLKSTSTMPEEQKPGVLYTVQIGAFSFITPHFTSLNEVMSCRGSDGILRCFVGKFSTKQEAIWYRDHLRASDFKDAFVTEMDSKHNPSISGQISYLSLK